MMRRAALLLLAAALTASAATPAFSAGQVAAKRDWSRAVAPTVEGGFRMGNPNAPVKLVEYGSLACPHCRHFEETGFKPLVQNYVRGGRVSYEFRNLLIDGPDISISMLAHCAGAARFFPMSSYVFATQPQWQKKLVDMSDADKATLESLSDQERVARYAEIAGMSAIAGRFGMTSAQSKQCLSNPEGLKRLLDMTQAGMAAGVEHTPTFIINGKMVDAATWEDLEPLIRQAAGRR